MGPSVLSPLCGLSTAAARLGSGTLLAFTRRQKGERLVLDAHRQWELAGVRDVEHRAATPQQLGTGPQVCLRFSREGHLQISATSNTREELTLPSQQGPGWLHGNFPGLTQSAFQRSFGTKGGRLKRKGQRLRWKRNSYLGQRLYPAISTYPKHQKSELQPKLQVCLPGTEIIHHKHKSLT